MTCADSESAFKHYGVPEGCSSISSMLAAVARRRPDELAVSDGSRELTWRQLDGAVSAFAAQIQGVRRLAVLSRDTIEMMVAMYGSARAHAVFCPIASAYTTSEVRRALEQMGADAVFAPSPFSDRVTEAGFGPESLRRVTPDITATAPTVVLPGRDPKDIAWVISTSGSTAAPKPVLIPEQSILLTGFAYAHAMNSGPTDKWLNFFPFFHTSGGWLTIHALAAECSTRLMPNGFDAREGLEAITHGGVTHFGGFELFWKRMRALPEWETADISGLTGVTISGNLSLYDMLEDLGVPQIFQIYGSTETGLASITSRHEDDREARKYSNGHPTFGTEIRIVDPETGRDVPAGSPGEILTRGPFSAHGYMSGEDPEGIFDPEGWVHSGDHGWVDEAGRLYFRGRLKHVIKTGGENVSSREVEIALETLCENVLTAQVVGAPDPEWGEAVIAFVEIREETEFDADEIKSVLRDHLAPYKIPKQFIRMGPADWPITGNGKIHRPELEPMAASARAEQLALVR